MASIRPWHVLRERLLLDRSPWLKVVAQDVVLPDGSELEGFLLSPVRDYTMIFALTPEGRVPLVHQYKHGLRRAAYDLPAGYLDADEVPLVGAQRELLEETGLAAPRWEALASPPIDTNRNDNRAHLFLARDAHAVATPQLEASEAGLTVAFFDLPRLRDLWQHDDTLSLASSAAIGLALQRLGQIE
jgi:ADP-ribose pyrophosphatase